MSQSILQQNKKCFVTGKTEDLHKHHIYPGNPNRNISERNGFWVWLSADQHNMSNNGIHNNPIELDKLKIHCQKTYEAQGHSRQEFIRLIGRNYIMESSEFKQLANAHNAKLYLLNNVPCAQIPQPKAKLFIDAISDRHHFNPRIIKMQQGIICIDITPYLDY